jgi:hypothetical protein
MHGKARRPNLILDFFQKAVIAMKPMEKWELLCWQPYCTCKNVPGKIKLVVERIGGASPGEPDFPITKLQLTEGKSSSNCAELERCFQNQ